MFEAGHTLSNCQGPSFLVSMLDFGGVFSSKWVCEGAETVKLGMRIPLSLLDRHIATGWISLGILSGVWKTQVSFFFHFLM